jgi:hypothetical protein
MTLAQALHVGEQNTPIASALLAFCALIKQAGGGGSD